ncbi:MAG: protein translocase subunit SecD [Deltaproteobacteria bacterium]|nr:protein translocase subunit SecD [Deltaproteobacteria bacterium]
MSTAWKYKFVAMIAGILVSLYLLVPTVIGIKNIKQDYKKQGKALPWYYNLLPQNELNLGLDLQGGLYMELEVGVEEALRHQVDFIAGDIRRVIIGDKIKDANITQIYNHRLRIELKPDQKADFNRELAGYFGNNVFVIEADNFEVFLRVTGNDTGEARKKAFEEAQKVPGFDGNIDITRQGKFLAVSFKNNNTKAAVRQMLGKEENKAFFIDETDIMNDVLYLTVTEEQLNYYSQNIMQQAANSARNRIDRFGVAEAAVSRQSTDRLVVELPGVNTTDQEQIIDIIKRTGKLEFRLVNDTLSQTELEKMIVEKVKELKLTTIYQSSSVDSLNEALKAELPPDSQIAFRHIRDPQTKKVKRVVPFLLEKKAEVTGDMLDNASVQTEKNMPYVSMSFNKAGAKKFGDLTSANVGKYLAIVLDDVVNSAPVIKSAITGGQAQIELGYGNFTDLQKEAQDLVLVLKEGALPASLTVATKNVIGPSLGRDSINAGIKSLIIAAIVVVLFMLLYYKVGGIVANIALIANVLFIFGILSLFQASLTLPGIAGIVLTMGMAVDANVIIFERMREEMFLGQKPGLVVESGYSNAMSAILDGNITTFISGLVLFEFGTGPIKGFATTLMIGIVTTLITAVVLTRVIYDWMVVSVKIQKVRI